MMEDAARDLADLLKTVPGAEDVLTVKNEGVQYYTVSIDRLAAQEELEALRPELDGEQIMRILQLDPGPQVGEAYRYLLEVRLERGPIGPEAAEAELLRWWRSRPGD